MPPPARARTALPLLLVALGACGPKVQVSAERSRIATFGRYETWAWSVPAAPARTASETNAALLDWRIRNTIERALAAKGYVRMDGHATLVADYYVTVPAGASAGFEQYFRD